MHQKSCAFANEQARVWVRFLAIIDSGAIQKNAREAVQKNEVIKYLLRTRKHFAGLVTTPCIIPGRQSCKKGSKPVVSDTAGGIRSSWGYFQPRTPGWIFCRVNGRSIEPLEQDRVLKIIVIAKLEALAKKTPQKIQKWLNENRKHPRGNPHYVENALFPFFLMSKRLRSFGLAMKNGWTPFNLNFQVWRKLQSFRGKFNTRHFRPNLWTKGGDCVSLWEIKTRIPRPKVVAGKHTKIKFWGNNTKKFCSVSTTVSKK